MKHLPAFAAALALGCAPAALAATSGGQLLNGRQQFVDANGAPLAGGAVNIWLPGTTTPVTTYQDSALTIANTNPVVLDSGGRASIWAAPGSYREQVLDARGDLIWDQTTLAAGASASALTPGATIGTSGDVACAAQTFTGAAAITLSCVVQAATTSTAGKVQLATNAIAQAGASTTEAVTPAALASIVQGQAMTYAADTSSTANTVTLSPKPALGAPVTGQQLTFKLANSSSGALTLAISGATGVGLYSGAQPVGAGLLAGRLYAIVYDGARWQLASPAAGCSGANCWEIAPGDLWREWGTSGSVAGNGTLAVTLPVACPSSPVFASATGTAGQANAVQVTAVSATSITLQNSGGTAQPIYWSVTCN